MLLTADFDGRLELEEVGLAEEDVLGGGAELPNLHLAELHLLHLLLTWTAPPHLQETPDHGVQGRVVHRFSDQSSESIK